MPRQSLRPPVLAALVAVLVAPAAGVPGVAAQSPPAETPNAHDQAAPEPAAQDSGRPRVGLVLGGGGARGIAHVGVLGVLEELGVRVDVVVGTSMGAIVGALYASGMPPQAMEEWVRGADWDELFRDQASFRSLQFRRKREYRAFPIPLELGVNRHGLSTPSGFIAGQKLNAALRGLLLPVATVRDFDDLPIPYRAIATELTTGRMVILGSGDLVDAVRASMSAPGVFSPYPVGGRLLADGGLTANLPADVARTLGADVLIVVDVGAPLLGEGELTTPVRAAVQVATILTQAGAEAQRQTLQPGDILIVPELANIRSTGFDYALEALAAGEAAARSQVSALRGLAVDPVAFAAWVDTVRAERPLPQTIDFVNVGDQLGRAPRSNLDRVRIRPGAALDTLVIAADVDRLYQVGIYERTDYRLMRVDEGLVLSYKVQAKPWGRNYLRFRLSVSDNFARCASNCTSRSVGAAGPSWPHTPGRPGSRGMSTRPEGPWPGTRWTGIGTAWRPGGAWVRGLRAGRAWRSDRSRPPRASGARICPISGPRSGRSTSSSSSMLWMTPSSPAGASPPASSTESSTRRWAPTIPTRAWPATSSCPSRGVAPRSWPAAASRRVWTRRSRPMTRSPWAGSCA
jgi:predicted acylesterase/phospholipase RssA